MDSDEAANEYKEVFQLFDHDDDGVITAEQFSTVLRALGKPATELQLSIFIQSINSMGKGKEESEENKSEENKSEENKPEENKPEENKENKPEEKKPEEKKDTVNLTDFLTWVPSYIRQDDYPERALLDAFKRFDTNNSGMITTTELRQIMTGFGVHLDDEEVDELIREADAEGSGNVHYEGFIPMLSQST